MYLWNTQQLAGDIKSNSIVQSEWKKYYLAISIILSISMYLSMLSPQENTMALYIEAIVVIAITIGGVHLTYLANKGDQGVDYIARMTALALPVTVKLFLLSFAVGILVGVLSSALSIPESALDWLMVFVSPGLQVLFFWRITIYLKYINT